MRISVGSKRLKNKPDTQQEKTRYFKGLKFKTEDFSNDKIKKMIGKGTTITYLYKDDVFDRTNHYMSNNYLGTQFICVDIDKCNIPPSDFVDMIKYKPSVLHTTFSNLTQRKENKFCYHLLYFFDEIIYGEDNFKDVFNSLTDDYKEYVDKQARDCHRVMFTSNSSLPHYEFYDYGITYKVSDFINNNDSERHEIKEWDKMSSTHKSYYSQYNISVEKDLSQDTSIDNSFNLDSQFLKDMYSMKRSQFIAEYSSVYPYITQTEIDLTRYVNGFVDLRNEEYYVVPTSQYRWDTERQRPYIPKIKEGFRTTMLWLDIIHFMKIVPHISKEHLVYLATTEVYRNFDNSDKQLDNMFIINKCKEVWNNIGNIHVKPVKKSFKIDKNYWLERGMDNWLSITNHIRKQMKCDDFGSLYDCSLTVEQNIVEFKNYGVRTTPKTLKKWLDENGIPYKTDKEIRDEHVIKFYEQNSTRSSREIERLCNQIGIEVNYRTIQRILSRHNSKKAECLS